MQEKNGKQRKFLNVVADDFGYGFDRNQGIVDCFLKGSISCTSVLVNCKHTESGVQLLKEHGIPSGLHFNLTEGLPVSNVKNVSSLVDKQGHFLGKEAFWTKKCISSDHVKTELIAQIEKYSKLLGSLPLRVDGHQHVHVHPQVQQVFAATLAHYNIKETRVPLEYHTNSECAIATTHTEARNQFHLKIFNLASQAKEWFDRSGLVHSDVFIGMNFMGKLMKENKVQSILKEIYKRHSSCEFMVHPGFVSHLKSDGFVGDECSDEFSRSQGRAHEMELLMSDSMNKFYHHENIDLKF